MVDKIIELKSYGTSFATRDRARAIGREISQACGVEGANIVMDFRDVVVVSYSFADQLATEVMDLLHDWGHRHDVTLINCNEQPIKVLTTVLNRRNEIEPTSPRPDVYSDHIALASAR